VTKKHHAFNEVNHGQYTAEEWEFIHEIQLFQERRNVRYPTCRQILAIAKALGYRQQSAERLSNERRLFLIGEKSRRKLRKAERLELIGLQIEHGKRLDALQPPPWEKLEELEAFARSLDVR
jgi:hypothetical protein